MRRTLYLAGFAYLAVCAFAVAKRGGPPAEPPAVAYQGGTGGDAWFAGVRGFCNPVEVEVALRGSPPPAGTQGAGYAAACLALAGKIERARGVIDALPGEERRVAADIVFAVGHPVADAGDDEAAGPIMSLVLEYRPDNYMALYHAGMSEYALGHADAARRHLTSFVRLYRAEDGWTAGARSVLGRLGTPEAP